MYQIKNILFLNSQCPQECPWTFGIVQTYPWIIKCPRMISIIPVWPPICGCPDHWITSSPVMQMKKCSCKVEHLFFILETDSPKHWECQTVTLPLNIHSRYQPLCLHGGQGINMDMMSLDSIIISIDLKISKTCCRANETKHAKIATF